MGSNKLFQVRFTSSQFNKIKSDARLRGFEYLSEYVRTTLLNIALKEKKIDEIYYLLSGKGNSKSLEVKNQRERAMKFNVY